MSEVPEHDPIHPEGSGTPDEGQATPPQPDQAGSPEPEITRENEAPSEPAPEPAHAGASEMPHDEQAVPAQAEQTAPERETAHEQEAPPEPATEQEQLYDAIYEAPNAEHVANPEPVETAPTGTWAAYADQSQHEYTQTDGPTFLPPVPLEPYRRPARTPHLGHVVLFGLLLIFGWVGSMIFIFTAMHAHLFGVTTISQVKTSAPYLLGSEAILYLITLGACLLIFPIVWHKRFLEGLQWNGAAAKHRWLVLLSTAFACFLLAMLSQYLLPGPQNAPIDKIFRAPGAAWIMFFFGITFAPFFEEMVFRGLLLPAFCTACDWIGEKFRHEDPPPLYENGHPQWSFGAMVFGSVAASIPFALMHAPQTGYSLGPFTLLIVVSLVLCWARLSSRSLAASVMLHATYNFLLFTVMLFGTHFFTNMHKL